jgi:RNA polymerase sigma-70 factor (ECF subfamily)
MRATPLKQWALLKQSADERTIESLSERNIESLSERNIESLSERNAKSLSEKNTESLSEKNTESLSERNTESLSERNTESLSERNTKNTSEKSPIKRQADCYRDAEQLARGIQGGDKTMEDIFCQRYYPAVRRQLGGYTRDQFKAEDITHDVMLTLLLRLRSRGIDEPRYLDRFVHQTARYSYFSWLRQPANQQATLQTIPQPVDTNEDAEQRLLNAEQRRLTLCLLTRLPVERDRQVLWRSYFQEESKQSLCEALALSNAHFDRVIFRARKRLRAVVESANSEVSEALMSARP